MSEAKANRDGSSPRSWRAPRWQLLGLMLVTLVIRTGILLAMQGNLADDPDAYREIAENILQHGVYGLGKQGSPRPTAYRPPLYPLLLSNLPATGSPRVSLVKVAVVHVLLGAGTVWLTYWTARRMLDGAAVSSPERSHRSALLAGLCVAFDPILLNQSTLLMTETLATFLAILALWCLTGFDANRNWWNAGLAGGSIALAVLCRPTFLPWLGLVAATMLISDFRLRKLAARLTNVLVFVIAVAAVLSPWVVRNQRQMGKPIVTTTHGGYTLALGNNEYFYGWLNDGEDSTPWNSDSFDNEFRIETTMLIPPDEVELFADQWGYALGRQRIREFPRSFALSALYRLRQLWTPLPYKLSAEESPRRTALRYATAAWYCGVYALAAVGMWRLRWNLVRPPMLYGLLLVFTFMAVHTFYWCNVRMRAPLMPFVAIVAGASLLSAANVKGSGVFGGGRLSS